MSLKSIIRNNTPLPIRQAINRLRNRGTMKVSGAFAKLMQTVKEGEVLVTSQDLKGEFWLDIRSHLVRRIAIDGHYEPQVAAAIVNHADRDFIDVGANVGFFSVHMALQPSWAGKVLSIEPNPRAYAFLQRNLEQNGVSGRVEAVRYAVADVTTELELTAVEGREEYSTISNSTHPSIEGLKSTKFVVPAAPLDSILEGRDLHPSLIKVDAEGAELEVLRGMQATVEEFRPTLICEIGGATFGSDVDAIKEQFAAMRYNLFGFDGSPTELDRNLGGEIIARPQ